MAMSSNQGDDDGMVQGINVTPLVDITLVLLIIFMVTAPLLTAGVDVDLPKTQAAQATGQDEPLVVDSNVIIDGRLPDLCATGFVSSSLVIPRFILGELQRLSDSSDAQKRDRGRTALDRL